VSNLDSDSLTKEKLFPYPFFKSAVYHVCGGRLLKYKREGVEGGKESGILLEVIFQFYHVDFIHTSLGTSSSPVLQSISELWRAMVL